MRKWYGPYFFKEHRKLPNSLFTEISPPFLKYAVVVLSASINDTRLTSRKNCPYKTDTTLRNKILSDKMQATSS